FDGCYDFMSARAYGGGAADGSANTVTVQNSLIRVQGMDKLYPGLSAPGYGGFWKWSGSGSPNTDIGPMLVITNTVFRADAPPVVSRWSPGLAGSSTLTGTVTLVATAVDDQALGGVQFALNGQPIGAEVSTAATPAKFPLTWDSHGLANGTYTLTATARDVAGHRTTSAGVTVTISN